MVPASHVFLVMNQVTSHQPLHNVVMVQARSLFLVITQATSHCSNTIWWGFQSFVCNDDENSL